MAVSSRCHLLASAIASFTRLCWIARERGGELDRIDSHAGESVKGGDAGNHMHLSNYFRKYPFQFSETKSHVNAGLRSM